jgi:hypothetical protein
MVVAAPLVAELAMPRFISPGDSATIALDVTNLSGAKQEVTVQVEGVSRCASPASTGPSRWPTPAAHGAALHRRGHRRLRPGTHQGHGHGGKR